MEVKRYEVDFWDGIEWWVSGTFKTKSEAEEEMNELLKTCELDDIRVIGYFT